MSLLNNLPHTVTHTRRKYLRDEYMGNTTQIETLSTGVSAWVQNASQREIEQYQKRDELITHKVYYASDPSIRPGDRITVTAGPSFVGDVFNYESLTDRSAGLGVLFRIMVNAENNKRASFDD
jgi:hypothetical protein